jgi:hypothetical protein
LRALLQPVVDARKKLIKEAVNCASSLFFLNRSFGNSRLFTLSCSEDFIEITAMNMPTRMRIPAAKTIPQKNFCVSKALSDQSS